MTLEELSEQVRELTVTVTRLTTLVEQEGRLCPYREDIRKAANNSDRLTAVEGKIHVLDKEVMRVSLLPGVAGGGVVAMICGIVAGILKVAGVI